MATSNTGIASLPDTMSQDDPWAWLNWAQQREPDTYAWDTIKGASDPFSAGPSWWAGPVAEGADPHASMTPEQAQAMADAGYTFRQARGPGYSKLWQVVGPDGNVVDQGGFNKTDSLHGADYAMFASVAMPAIAPYISGAYGATGLAAGTAGNAAATGATMGGALGHMRTGTFEGGLQGAALGGLAGYAGNSLIGGASTDPYGPGSNWGQDTFTNMGYSPAEIAAIQSGAATVGDAGGISWGGTSNPNGIGSLTDGFDPYAFDAGYNTGDINYGSDPINTQPGEPVGATGAASAPPSQTPSGSGYQEQVIDIRPPANNVTPPAPAGGLPTLPLPAANIPTTPQVPDIKVPDVPEYKMPDQAAPKNDLEKFWDWAKANPKLAMQLFGLGASAFGGKNNGGSGAGGPGTGPQSGMTSTPAAPLNRHYVAPPAGYRPGFDPEWQYFQPGPAPAGTSTTQPVQGKVGIASVSNTPTFTSGSSIGSPSVNKPYTPGPNNNMTMNGQPLTPTFSGVGAGSPPPANVPQQAAPTYTPEQLALANAYKAHLGFADGAGAGVSTEDALARLANEQRRFDLFGDDSTSLFKNNPALYAAYKSGNAGAFTSALGPQQNNASAAYRYTGDAASAAAGQAEMAKLDAQKAAEVAATQPGGPMFGGVGSLPKPQGD